MSWAVQNEKGSGNIEENQNQKRGFKRRWFCPKMELKILKKNWNERERIEM